MNETNQKANNEEGFLTLNKRLSFIENYEELSKSEIAKYIKQFKEQFKEELMKKYHFKVIRGRSKIVYAYIDGYYITHGEDIIKEQYERFESMPSLTSTRQFLESIKNSSFIDEEEFKSAKNLVNLSNNVYDINTGKVYSHNPEYNFLYKIPNINYNPDAKNPITIEYIKSLVKNDEHSYKMLQRFIGSIFMSDYRFKGFLMCYGDGNNGKSKFTEYLTKLFGFKNCCSVPMHNVNDRFAKVEFYGKLLNVSAETSDKDLKQFDMIKTLTGDSDTIMAENKGKDAFKFVNYAKLVFMCNKLPYVDNADSAYWARKILVHFNNKFTGDNVDYNILDKLATEEELSGTFNWAMEGFYELMETHGFGLDPEKVKEEYEFAMGSDFYHVKLFYETCIDEAFGVKILHSDVYDAYTKFCDKNSIVNVLSTEVSFNKIFRKITGLDDSNTVKYVNKKTVRAWPNIIIKYESL